MKKIKKLVKLLDKNFIFKICIVTFVVIMLSLISVYIQRKEKNIFKINGKEFEKEYGKVCVLFSGAINNPGMYNLSEDTKLAEALNIIGGVKMDADLSKVILSKILLDEEKIVIPYKQDESFIEQEIESKNNENKYEEKININDADVSLLSTLPGIGESTANKIVEYRKNGDFESIEDIKRVSGIGDGKFEKIKDKITVE